jgi:hypothetical protein
MTYSDECCKKRKTYFFESLGDLKSLFALCHTQGEKIEERRKKYCLVREMILNHLSTFFRIKVSNVNSKTLENFKTASLSN